jgi:3-hydroxymyristoyl/3-hydroxydecanoyl-(acyl carrier protein) dehydratase
MMWGMGIWRDGTQGSAAFRSSDLFVTRLTGPMNAVREAWGIGPDVEPSQFWAAYFISAPVSVVRKAVERESRVFLTHVNTPEECMIAGDPAACYRVLEAVKAETGGETVKAPFNVVIHSDVMMSEYGEYYRLHHLPVTTSGAANITFYSAADYAPVPLESGAIAASIARMACKPVDFPRLIERAYADGARTFIELGPRSTCARWINETLGERPHLAASIDVLGAEGRVSLVKLLAHLLAHRVPVDVSPLFAQPKQAAANGRSLVRHVTLGGQDIIKAIAQAEIAGLPQGVTTTTAGTQYTAPAQPAAATPSLGDAAVAAVHNAHTLFLDTRQDALRGLGEMIQMQIARGDIQTPPGNAGTQSTAPAPEPEPQAPALPPVPPPNTNTAPSVRQGITPQYDRHAIETFATGRIADCFGDLYAIYDDRRAPRIPNGDLLLVSRAVSITGERFKSVPGTAIHAEYDVPADMWWYRDTPYPYMPYSMYMEIALQPCGFLSAYHGPTLDFPDVDFYFRNLDGTGKLYKDVDMRGRTITNHVTLTGSTVMQGIIIQKYTFALFDEEELFYEGDAAFGYFTQEALNSQAGLDAGKRMPRWIDEAQPDPSQVIDVNPHAQLGEGYLTLGSGKLEFTDEIKVVPGGGKYGQGYAYANTIINPDAWYFKNHFYEDPVMPGSIGLETVHQAMQAYAIVTGLADDFTAPRFAQVDGPLTGQDAHTTVWKYRGQILSSSDKSHVEANIKRIETTPGRVVMIADASLWRDDLRIYEAKDIALAIVEA